MLSWLDTHTLTLISLETMVVSVIGGLLLLLRLRRHQHAAGASTSASGTSTTEAAANAQRLLDALPLEAPAIAHLRARCDATQPVDDAAPSLAHAVLARELALATGTAPAPLPSDISGLWPEIRGTWETQLIAAAERLPQYPWAELAKTLAPLDEAAGCPPIEFPEVAPTSEDDKPQTRLLGALDSARDALEDVDLTAAPTVMPDLDTARGVAGEWPDAAARDASKEADLRKMIMQFTQDSRDMLECIRDLEVENAELKERLGDAGTSSGSAEETADAEET